MAEVAGLTKGERTSQRIMDAAEELFARHGYEGTSLRMVAGLAGIREPGLYNYFRNKQELYTAVLDRALMPMANAISDHVADSQGVKAYIDLPSVMIDLLLEHPPMAALFQQALQGDIESIGNQIIRGWLDRLLQQGADAMAAMGFDQLGREDQAIRIIAMFNLCTGYFLSQRAFASMAEGHITDPENIERHKKLVVRLVKTLLVD